MNAYSLYHTKMAKVTFRFIPNTLLAICERTAILSWYDFLVALYGSEVAIISPLCDAFFAPRRRLSIERTSRDASMPASCARNDESPAAISMLALMLSAPRAGDGYVLTSLLYYQMRRGCDFSTYFARLAAGGIGRIGAIID